MMELAKLFQQSLGAPINVDGRELYAVLNKKSEGLKAIQIRRISSSTIPVPGLCLQGNGVQFLVNNQILKDVVLWTDTSPDFVKVNIVSGKKNGEIKIWNCWRDSLGVTQAWLGNAAMNVEEKSGVLKVSCNSGPNELKFMDLIFELEFLISGESN
jgi:hypothetical protein